MKKKTTSQTLTTTIYDQRSIFQRIKEIITLPFFIIISALFSIIIMNLISVPVLSLVLKDPVLFTELVSWLIGILILVYILSRIISRIVFYVKTGLPVLTILKSIILNRLRSLFFFIFAIIVIAALGAGLIYLFNYNSVFIETFFN